MSSFSELGVSAPVCRALAERGFAEPFKIQKMVLADALDGKDILAKSKTGSGKTLGFAIPIVDRIERNAARPAALILVPTRELAGQVAEEMRTVAQARGLKVATAYGGVSIPAQADRARKAQVLVATPGRLEDLLNRKLISISEVKILVLDEADRMLDMGFQPQVDKIVRRLPKKRQTMFFSATLDGAVGNIARAYTHEPVRHEVKEDRPTISLANHRFVPVDERRKMETLLEVLGEDRDLALVFVRTKRGADRLQRRLKQKGVRAEAMHGDMSQPARNRSLARFDSGKTDILIATDVAARGLDLDGITHVINFDPPNDHKDYVHRVGRTARAGRAGTGVTFVAPNQLADVSVIARTLKLRDEFQAEGLQLMGPRTVFSSSRGRRSNMRPQRRRRF